MDILRLKDEKTGEWKEVPSIQGKSAYESAKDGGYTGTETEFNDRLAHGFAIGARIASGQEWGPESNKTFTIGFRPKVVIFQDHNNSEVTYNPWQFIAMESRYLDSNEYLYIEFLDNGFRIVSYEDYFVGVDNYYSWIAIG